MRVTLVFCITIIGRIVALCLANRYGGEMDNYLRPMVTVPFVIIMVSWALIFDVLHLQAALRQSSK